jgi:hypothetical protein
MRTARANNPSIRSLLNSLYPGCGEIYTRRLASTKAKEPIVFIKMKTMLDDDETTFSVIKKKFSFNAKNPNKRQDPNLFYPEVLRVVNEDIELTEEDRIGNIMLATKDDLEIHYGEKGIEASADRSPQKLLTKKKLITKDSFGVLEIEQGVPFQIRASNSVNVATLVRCHLMKVPTIEENVKRFSLDLISELPDDYGKKISIELQRRIFRDRNYENFYEEVTSKVFPPTEHVRSSGTLMNFERKQFGIDNTTDTHYHPGERVLLVFTTEKEAGVTLNFCGTEESPEDRKDCEVRKDFPRNSFLALTFPSYTHHKFHGEFVCLSIHPRDGQNIIDAVKSGTLPKGFLESATVFSKTKTEADKWEVSKSSGEQKKQGRSR